MTISAEVGYILLVFGLFVVPKLLQRFRLPSAVTSLVLGAGVGLGAHLFVGDPTIELFATLGIVALFLFAGLEVDFHELRSEVSMLLLHLVFQLATLGLVALGLAQVLPLAGRVAVLVALALVTPSTGFILDSLAGFGLTPRERFWVKSKAISTELVALGVLFVILQSESTARLGLSVLALGGLVLVVPLAFRAFAAGIQPYAPKSEFAFLLIVALICAFVTRQLGVYYLVGAFLVGVAAQRFRRNLPALASEKMLHSVEVFASFFVPFYFFKAGLHLRAEDLSWSALVAGVALLVIVVPVRVLVVAGHRRMVLHESWREALRISTPLLPTFVFTLVIADILRERFELPGWLFGGLVYYTVFNTVIPGLVLRLPPAEPDILGAAEEPDGAGPVDPVTLHPTGRSGHEQ